MFDINKYIPQHTLPSEVKEALIEKRVVNVDGNLYTLPPWQEAKLMNVLINHHYPPERGEIIPGDPCQLMEGKYCATAISLVSEIDDFIDPDEVLLWLPEVDMFGTYDASDELLYVYPHTTWAMIEEELPAYLFIEKNEIDIRCHLMLWEHLDFIPADFPANAEKMLYDRPEGTPDDMRDVEQFTWMYERTLLCHAFNPDLYEHYQALLNLYMYLTMHTKKLQSDESQPWLDKGVVIVQWLQQYQALLR